MTNALRVAVVLAAVVAGLAVVALCFMGGDRGRAARLVAAADRGGGVTDILTGVALLAYTAACVALGYWLRARVRWIAPPRPAAPVPSAPVTLEPAPLPREEDAMAEVRARMTAKVPAFAALPPATQELVARKLARSGRQHLGRLG